MLPGTAVGIMRRASAWHDHSALDVLSTTTDSHCSALEVEERPHAAGAADGVHRDRERPEGVDRVATIAAAPSGDLMSALTAIARRSSASTCATVSLSSAMSATAM